MNVRYTRCALALAILGAGVLTAGCGRSGSVKGGGVAETRAYVDKQDYKSAVISAKNGLRTKPDDAELRRLLGVSLLEGGDAAAAIVELRKARELGAPDTRTAPSIARALLAQREARQVIAQFASTQLDDAAASADLKTSVATAHAVLGDRAAAAENAEAALKEWPQHLGARLLQSRLAAADGRWNDAHAKIDEVLAAEPKNVTALMIRGDVLRQQGADVEQALASYRAAAAAKPDSVAAAGAIVALLVQQRRLPEAAADLAKLKAIAPNSAETRLLEAQLAYLNKDYARTREIAVQLLKAVPDNALLLQMAGDAEYRLGSHAAAENYLAQAVKVAPRALGARRLLAQLYLRTGQAPRALDVLQPVLAQDKPDAESLSLAGQALLLQGDAAKADAMFARAARQDPDNTTARIALALNKLSKGDDSTAFAELEAAAAADASPRAALALVAARLRGRDTAGAMRAIDGLERKQPTSALPHVLRGQVLMRQKDLAAARASFEKALAVDAKYFPATASLAELDLTAGKPELARQRYDAALKADPKNFRARIGMADVLARNGGSRDDIARLLSDAVKANPTEAAPRIALIEYLLRERDTKRAIAAAQESQAALPADMTLLRLLGTAELAGGQSQQAISTFGRLATAQPTQVQPELALADAHVAVKDYASARRSLERALKIDAKSLTAHTGLARLALLEQRPDDAIRAARAMRGTWPKSPIPYILEADAEIARGNNNAALTPLRAALPLADTPAVAIALHRTLLKLNRADDAGRVAADWQRGHPQDPSFAFYLGDMALARSEYPAAEAQYRAVTQIQPQNALALNNIAWLMTRQQKPGAVPLAEQANKLMPDSPPIIDTLAWALASENQTARALDVQKKAVATWPQDPTLKLTLAKIYAKAGDKTRARSELETLTKLGPAFAGQGEVAELMKTLQ